MEIENEGSMLYTPVRKIPVARVKNENGAVILEIKNPRSKVTEDVPLTLLYQKALYKAANECNVVPRELLGYTEKTE